MEVLSADTCTAYGECNAGSYATETPLSTGGKPKFPEPQQGCPGWLFLDRPLGTHIPSGHALHNHCNSGTPAAQALLQKIASMRKSM